MSARNGAPSSAASAALMRSWKRATRRSFTSSMVGSCHLLDRLARRALDHTQHVAFARRDEQDRLAAAAGAARAADAMHVGLGVVRHVVVDDVAHALDIEPARCDIRGDDDIDLAALQSRDRAFALRLHDVAVQRLGGEAARFQALAPALRSRSWCA